MRFKVLPVFVFFVCSLLSGVCFAQNKVVVVPFMSDCNCPEVPTVETPTGRVWMDRNLGAYRVAQSVNDYHSYGYLFQWGRDSEGHELRHSDTTSTQSPTVDPAHDDFITGHTDWRPTYNDAWNGVAADYNPCPEGFRIPTKAEWEDEQALFEPKDREGAFLSPLRLPAAGMRRYDNGDLESQGYGLDYWSATPDLENPAQAWSLHCGGGYCEAVSRFRARGISVRCIKN